MKGSSRFQSGQAPFPVSPEGDRRKGREVPPTPPKAAAPPDKRDFKTLPLKSPL